MSDLTDTQSALPTKVVGASGSGLETNFVDASSEGRMLVHIPGSSTASNTRPSVTNTSSIVLAANSSRKFAIISNNSGATIYLKQGATAVTNQGIALVSGAVYFINQNQNLWLGDVHAIKSGGSVNLDVFEATT